MLILLAALLGTVGVYLLITAANAVQSGVLVPKSPDYPVELASQPVFFWLLVTAMAVAGVLSVYVGWLMLREQRHSAGD